MADAGAPMIVFEGHGLAVHRLAAFARVNLRGRGGEPKFAQAIEGVAGVAPPSKSNTAASGLLANLLWLGPDEWLLTSQTQQAADLVTRLRVALKGMHVAITDVTDARVVFSASGARARDLLALGCPIDFHPRVFGQGHCAQSLLAKASVLLHQRGPEPTFDIYVARSISDYMAAWLEHASRGIVQS